MKYLITGGCGFVGSNLAAEVINRNEELIISDNFTRIGSEKNLEWLKQLGKFTFYNSDIRNYNDVETIIKKSKPDIIFHLAGQVAMTTSIENPRFDFEINTLGTNNLLDVVRKYSPGSAILYSSTNKVYGDLSQFTYTETDSRYVCNEFPKGFNEQVQLDFQSPYGCSKGAADQYLLDYYRMFDIKTVVFRHSSMYGSRQFATYDQGWIGWFCRKALEIMNDKTNEAFTISGNGKQVRDLLFVNDIVELYFKAAEMIEKIKGNAFNIGGGFENSLSILELINYLEKTLKIKMNFTKIPWRKSDQKVFIADNKKVNGLIGWKPEINYEHGLEKMLNWIKI